MSLLLETSLGDITIDLDITNSPNLCRNILKLAKARYYTNTLLYNVQHGRFCQLGDPRGDGLGGCSIYGLIDSTLNASNHSNHGNHGNSSNHHVQVEKSQKRFLKSSGNKILNAQELMEKGQVVATEMNGVPNTIGSQFLITIDSGKNKALDGIYNIHTNHDDDHNNNNTTNNRNYSNTATNYYSIGKVVEDDHDVLSKINALYCDKNGRPYADVRIKRMYILHDPYHNDDPENMDLLLQKRNITLMNEQDLPSNYSICAKWMAISSPKYDKPMEEIVEERISYEEAMMEQGDAEMERKRMEETLKKEDKSNAAILEMLGDIASADMKPPENVLFVCKLNPMTEDEDLQLIFSRFDPDAKAEIIRDQDTGDSLQYAFIEFGTKEACNEAYFKMNNALIDDRRIKVDFSQSVAKEWNRYTQRKRGITGRREGKGPFQGGSMSYDNHRQQHHQKQQLLHKPKDEKKYYGGYRENRTFNAYGNHHDSRNPVSNQMYREGHGQHSRDSNQRRKRSLSSTSDKSLSSSSSISYAKKKNDMRNRGRSLSYSDNDDEHRRRREESRSHHDRRDGKHERYEKKRKHKDRRYYSRKHHHKEEERHRKKDRKKSKSRRGRSRSHSRDHDRGGNKKRYRSRSH